MGTAGEFLISPCFSHPGELGKELFDGACVHGHAAKQSLSALVLITSLSKSVNRGFSSCPGVCPGCL